MVNLASAGEFTEERIRRPKLRHMFVTEAVIGGGVVKYVSNTHLLWISCSRVQINYSLNIKHIVK